MWNYKIFSSNVFIFIFFRGGKMSEAPVVNVEEGALQGKFITNDFGKSFYSFLGIPYAKPPLGSLRFKVRMQFL